MTNLVEPRRAADTENDAGGGALGDGELTALVRRWMAAGTKVQERVRRESVARPAPAPEQAPPDLAAATAPDVPSGSEVETLATPGPELQEAPRLPHRPSAPEGEQATRVAVLIDARRVPEDVATALLARLGARGAVSVCRAYADWTRADLGDWVARMRLEGLHSFHQFSDDDDQALVALALDAVDIARDAAVDEVVVAGDPTSLLPLVHRLHAAGVRVVVVGPAHTPHDVRAACDEFWDSASIPTGALAPAGRHRA